MVNIRTNKKVYEARNGELCFLLREMIVFSHLIEEPIFKFKSIVRDSAFIEIEEDEIGEDGKPTGEKKITRKIIEKLRTKPYRFTKEQVKMVYKASGLNIPKNANFPDKFEEIQQKALLLDTIIPLKNKDHSIYKTKPEDWEND